MPCMSTKAEFSSVKTSGASHNTVRIKILITSNYELQILSVICVSFGKCLLTRRHIPEDINLNQRYCETLKYGIMLRLFIMN